MCSCRVFISIKYWAQLVQWYDSYRIKIGITGKTSYVKGKVYSCRSAKPNFFHDHSPCNCSTRCFSERWFDSSSDLLIRCCSLFPASRLCHSFLSADYCVVVIFCRLNFFWINCPLNNRTFHRNIDFIIYSVSANICLLRNLT